MLSIKLLAACHNFAISLSISTYLVVESTFNCDSSFHVLVEVGY